MPDNGPDEWDADRESARLAEAIRDGRTAHAMMWGKTKENGIWLATKGRRRLMFRDHDSLYVALGRLRLRLMKPW